MTNNRISEVTTMQQEPGQEQRVVSFKVTQLIWIAAGILETLIALRILLKLIAANPESPIVALIYGFTGLFLFVFQGMTVTPSAGGMVLEISSVFAMVIYALLSWCFERLVWVIFYRPREKTVSVTQTSTSDRRI
jgi:hypothetical protein